MTSLCRQRKTAIDLQAEFCNKVYMAYLFAESMSVMKNIPCRCALWQIQEFLIARK